MGNGMESGKSEKNASDIRHNMKRKDPNHLKTGRVNIERDYNININTV